MDNGPDKRWVRASFDRAATSYDAAAVLQREVADRLLEQLDYVRLQPKRVLDLGAGTGYCTEALAKRYKKAHIIAFDLAEGMLKQARKRFNPITRHFRGHGFACGDAESLPFADNSFDLIVSSLTMQWCHDLEKTFNELRRVLKPGGLIQFSTFGPDTLKELRAAWSAVDGFTHVNEFLDMHVVGDAMVHAQFADPVMSMETITLTYETAVDLMKDLKAIGAHNVNQNRNHQLMGKRRLQAFIDAYEAFRNEGRLPATYEVVYGHAWAPDTPQQQQSDGATVIDLQQMRAGLQRK